MDSGIQDAADVAGPGGCRSLRFAQYQLPQLAAVVPEYPIGVSPAADAMGGWFGYKGFGTALGGPGWWADVVVQGDYIGGQTPPEQRRNHDPESQGTAGFLSGPHAVMAHRIRGMDSSIPASR